MVSLHRILLSVAVATAPLLSPLVTPTHLRAQQSGDQEPGDQEPGNQDSRLADPQELAAKEAELLTSTRQLIFEGKRSGESYFSQDGRYLVFQSEREPGNPFYQIYLMDLETGDVERVSPGMGKTTCAWIHPDNDRVMYASTHSDPESETLQQQELDFRASGKERRYAWDYDRNFEIYAYSRSSGDNTRLTFAPGYDAEGSYSPDGEWICFSSNRAAFLEPMTPEDQQRFEIDQSLFLDLYMMRADGTDVRRLTFAKGYDGGPFFSADGTRICWRRFNEEGTQAEIWTMNVDGSDKRQLTTIGAMSWAPYFHPSGEYLIFTTNRHGFANFELYLVDAKGEREPVRVTYTNGFDGLPVFSPDGGKLAFTSVRTEDRKAQVFLADWNHEAALRKLRGSPARGATTQQAGAQAHGEPSQSTARITARELMDRFLAIGATDAPSVVNYLEDVVMRTDNLPSGFGLTSSQSAGGTEGFTFILRDEIQMAGPVVLSVPADSPAAKAAAVEIVEALCADGDALGAQRNLVVLFERQGEAPPEGLFAGTPHTIVRFDVHGTGSGKLQVHGVDTAAMWRREIERRNAPVGAPLQLLSMWNPALTDGRTSAWPGLRQRPHIAVFEPFKQGQVDLDRLVKAARFTQLLIRSLLRMEATPRVHRPGRHPPGIGPLRR